MTHMARDWIDEVRLDDEEDYEARLSASQLKTFKRCPWQYKLSYVDGKPTLEDSSPYLLLGTLVHEAIEHVLLDLEDGDFSGENVMRNMIRSKFDEMHDAHDRALDDDFYDDAISCIETAAKYLDLRYSEGQRLRDIERKFEFTLGRVDIQSKFVGYIDVTTEDEVWDWKTGSAPDQEEPSEDELIQGSVYMRGYQELYGEPPEEIKFVYIKEGKERPVTTDDESWQQMINVAKNLVNARRNGVFEADPDEGKCYWCSHGMFCSHNEYGAGDLEWEHV